MSKTSCIIHRNSSLSLSVKLLITHISHGWALESDHHHILLVCFLRLCCCSFFGCCCLGSWNERETFLLYIQQVGRWRRENPWDLAGQLAWHMHKKTIKWYGFNKGGKWRPKPVIDLWHPHICTIKCIHLNKQYTCTHRETEDNRLYRPFSLSF